MVLSPVTFIKLSMSYIRTPKRLPKPSYIKKTEEITPIITLIYIEKYTPPPKTKK